MKLYAFALVVGGLLGMTAACTCVTSVDAPRVEVYLPLTPAARQLSTGTQVSDRYWAQLSFSFLPFAGCEHRAMGHPDCFCVSLLLQSGADS